MQKFSPNCHPALNLAFIYNRTFSQKSFYKLKPLNNGHIRIADNISATESV